ncbi:uncharacterized protein LOC143974765 [Lithobates pipiens]
MKTAVFIVCLVGLAYAYPTSSDSNSSPVDSPESHDTSSSEEFTITIPPAVSITLEPSTDQPRGDSLRLRRVLRQLASSSESHSNSISISINDSSSEEEVLTTVPTINETTDGQALTKSLRRKRAAGQKPHSSSSEHSSESTATESTSSHTSESSEEDSHERSTKQNLLQGILETSTVPDTSEESSEERTTNTPIFQP